MEFAVMPSMIPRAAPVATSAAIPRATVTHAGAGMRRHRRAEGRGRAERRAPQAVSSPVGAVLLQPRLRSLQVDTPPAAGALQADTAPAARSGGQNSEATLQRSAIPLVSTRCRPTGLKILFLCS